MDKIKIMGFHQSPSTIIFDDPSYPNDTPKIHLIYMKRCVIDVKTNYIEALNLRGCNHPPPPSEDEG